MFQYFTLTKPGALEGKGKDPYTFWSCSNTSGCGAKLKHFPTRYLLGKIVWRDTCPSCFTTIDKFGEWDLSAPPNYYRITTIGTGSNDPYLPTYTPKTQKARGIVALSSEMHPFGQHLGPLVIFEATDSEWATKFPKLVEYLGNNKVFARPCPPSPEHGFVESRVCASVEEVEKVRQETLAANEESEILLMIPIAAAYNAIWTPSMLSIGPGHDGATSGKDSFSFPLLGVDPLASGDQYENLRKQCNIPDDRDPYVEFVKGSSDSLRAVQLRHGPKLAKVSPDFIPGEIIVKEIVKTNGEDLLEWAKIVKVLREKEGLVVWHPGGTPVDHYSVHCRENGVPLVTSFEPAIGQTLAPKGEVDPLDPVKFLEGIAVVDGLSTNTDNRSGGLTALSLFALHNSVLLRGNLSFWIGCGVGALLKLGPVALRGEARHAKGVSPDRGDTWQVYGRKSISFHRASLSRVTQLLHYGFGDPNQRKSFGGKTWALCGAALCPLFNSVRDLAKDPTSENASKVLEALNVAVNQAHNGGWWLNKFISVSAYDEIPKGNVMFTLMLPDILFELENRRKNENVNVGRFVEKAAKWPDTVIEPLKWRKASPRISASEFTIELKAATVPSPKILRIPLTASQIEKMLKLTAEVIIKPGEIYLKTVDDEKVELWKEEPLVMESRTRDSSGKWITKGLS